jgi:hypothetical protein
MGVTQKEGDEWAASVMAGEMKNAWQKEDRPNQPDNRFPHQRPTSAIKKSPNYHRNYDTIDWSK